MAARTMWNGRVSGFGMIVIPIKLSNAVGDEGIKFRQVRKQDGSRIKYTRRALADGREVPYADIVKGYELANGEIVVLSDEDFEAAYGEKSRNAKLLAFTTPDSVPRTAAGPSYYVQPGEGSDQAYALLAEVLKRTGKVAVVSIAIGTRESLGVLYTPGDGYLVLEKLHWAADVRKPGFEAPAAPDAKSMLDLAEALVTEMTGTFNWEAFKDESEIRLNEMVQAKIGRGEAVGTPAPPSSNPAPPDLAQALKASVEAAKAARKAAAVPAPRTRRPRAAAKPKVSA